MSIVVGVDPGLLSGFCRVHVDRDNVWTITDIAYVRIPSKRSSWRDDTDRAMQWAKAILDYITSPPAGILAVERPGGHDNLFTARWFGTYEGIAMGLCLALGTVRYVPVPTVMAQKIVRDGVASTQLPDGATKPIKAVTVAWAQKTLSAHAETALLRKLTEAKQAEREAMADAVAIAVAAIEVNVNEK